MTFTKHILPSRNLSQVLIKYSPHILVKINDIKWNVLINFNWQLYQINKAHVWCMWRVLQGPLTELGRHFLALEAGFHGLSLGKIVKGLKEQSELLAHINHHSFPNIKDLSLGPWLKIEHPISCFFKGIFHIERRKHSHIK